MVMDMEEEISGNKPMEINSPTPIAKLPRPIARSAMKKAVEGASFDTTDDDKPWNLWD